MRHRKREGNGAIHRFLLDGSFVLLLLILVLAVIDLWATARFSIQEQKSLAREHQQTLEAELTRLKERRSELN